MTVPVFDYAAQAGERKRAHWLVRSAAVIMAAGFVIGGFLVSPMLLSCH